MSTLLACRCTHNRCKPLRFPDHAVAKPSNRRRFGRRTNLRVPTSRREPVHDAKPRHVHSRFVWQCVLLEFVEWRGRVGVRPSAFQWPIHPAVRHLQLGSRGPMGGRILRRHDQDERARSQNRSGRWDPPELSACKLIKTLKSNPLARPSNLGFHLYWSCHI